jgi:hypothetical protein
MMVYKISFNILVARSVIFLWLLTANHAFNAHEISSSRSLGNQSCRGFFSSAQEQFEEDGFIRYEQCSFLFVDG